MTKNPTIVVVDDDANLTSLTRRLFEEKGCSVYTASNGLHAIELLKEVTPDLVIVDIIMPGVSGYEVCRYIKNQISLKNSKVLVLSALNSDIDIKWAKDAGADDYLAKPFRKDQLFDKTDHLLSSH